MKHLKRVTIRLIESLIMMFVMWLMTTGGTVSKTLLDLAVAFFLTNLIEVLAIISYKLVMADIAIKESNRRWEEEIVPEISKFHNEQMLRKERLERLKRITKEKKEEVKSLYVNK